MLLQAFSNLTPVSALRSERRSKEVLLPFKKVEAEGQKDIEFTDLMITIGLLRK